VKKKERKATHSGQFSEVLQGIGYSNELKLGFRTVQSEWKNKNAITFA